MSKNKYIVIIELTLMIKIVYLINKKNQTMKTETTTSETKMLRMLKVWATMVISSLGVVLFYQWVGVHIDGLNALFLMLWNIVGPITLILAILMAFGILANDLGWVSAVMIGLSMLFIEFIAVTTCIFPGVLSIILCVIIYLVMLVDTPYKKLWVSLYLLGFLTGFSLDTYITLFVNTTASGYVLVGTWILALVPVIYDYYQIKKFNRSWFIKK